MIYILLCATSSRLTAALISDPHRAAHQSSIGQFGKSREKKNRSGGQGSGGKGLHTHLQKSETGIKRRAPFLHPELQL